METGPWVSGAGWAIPSLLAISLRIVSQGSLLPLCAFTSVPHKSQELKYTLHQVTHLTWACCLITERDEWLRHYASGRIHNRRGHLLRWHKCSPFLPISALRKWLRQSLEEQCAGFHHCTHAPSPCWVSWWALGIPGRLRSHLCPGVRLFKWKHGPLSVALHELCAPEKPIDPFKAQCADLKRESKDPFFITKQQRATRPEPCLQHGRGQCVCVSYSVRNRGWGDGMGGCSSLGELGLQLSSEERG